MKYITGFFMAWGNFLTLPCPCKRWDSDLKNLMLAFLPGIGLVIGAIWGALWLGIVYVGLPYMVASFIMTFVPWLLCGFIHLDGFMDCNDAIMSRKPLEQKQAILKDSHTGAFAVVSLAFWLLAYFCCISTAAGVGIDFVNLMLIPVVSRAVAAIEVLRNKPLGHSQYAEGAGAEDKSSKRKAVLIIFIQLVLFIALAALFSSYYLGSGICIASCGITTFISIAYARHQLGGMSGDLAGYGIVWGELAGVLALALI